MLSTESFWAPRSFLFPFPHQSSEYSWWRRRKRKNRIRVSCVSRVRASIHQPWELPPTLQRPRQELERVVTLAALFPVALRKTAAPPENTPESTYKKVFINSFSIWRADAWARIRKPSVEPKPQEAQWGSYFLYTEYLEVQGLRSLGIYSSCCSSV